MTPNSSQTTKVKLALVCSSGGHLFQLFSLKPLWENYDRFWVSFPTKDAKTLLEGENVHAAYYPTNKSILNFIRNLFLAFRLLWRERPTVLITTGAGVAVPFIYIAKCFKIKTIYLESITRIEHLSLSGKLVYRVADHFLVQWPELADAKPHTVFEGQVL